MRSDDERDQIDDFDDDQTVVADKSLHESDADVVPPAPPLPGFEASDAEPVNAYGETTIIAPAPELAQASGEGEVAASDLGETTVYEQFEQPEQPGQWQQPPAWQGYNQTGEVPPMPADQYAAPAYQPQSVAPFPPQVAAPTPPAPEFGAPTPPAPEFGAPTPPAPEFTAQYNTGQQDFLLPPAPASFDTGILPPGLENVDFSQEPAPKSSKMPLIIAAVCAVLLLGGAAGAYFSGVFDPLFGKGSGSSSTAESEGSTSKDSDKKSSASDDKAADSDLDTLFEQLNEKIKEADKAYEDAEAKDDSAPELEDLQAAIDEADRVYAAEDSTARQINKAIDNLDEQIAAVGKIPEPPTGDLAEINGEWCPASSTGGSDCFEIRHPRLVGEEGSITFSQKPAAGYASQAEFANCYSGSISRSGSSQRFVYCPAGAEAQIVPSNLNSLSSSAREDYVDDLYYHLSDPRVFMGDGSVLDLYVK